ncbi:MAG: hypothetical protein Q4G26_11080 [Paracoccus sp. (in: a-proteobacteria)]|nr:hypothetical protein [Paracoccus sp. (in: a-proteobacteria)]
MTSFADSEKRLIAALGRIDAALDRASVPGPAEAEPALVALRAENQALKRRLAEAHEETARLARANEALSALHDGDMAGDDALRAELDALKAARAAEIAALDDIMSGLEGLIARAPRASDAPYAEDVTPAPADILAFDTREG